jgi:peptidyl-prolyl cis-trans isomerase SurA
MRANDIPEKLRVVLVNQPIGVASKPFEAPDGLRILMVCDRQGEAAPNAGLPDREQIRRELEDQRLDIAARRYLRDLRRSAFVDIRV